MGIAIRVGDSIEIFQPETEACKPHFIETVVTGITENDDIITEDSVMIDGFSVNDFSLDDYRVSWVFNSQDTNIDEFQVNWEKQYWD